MSDSSLSRVEVVFNAALEMEPGPSRASFIEEACAGEPDVQREVESMVLALEQDPDFLETPLLGMPSTGKESGIYEGKQLGDYLLVEKIGNGGMGRVYRSVRADQEYDQDVAIKVLEPRVRTTEMVARFRAERQILADLVHPGIARFFGGGTDDGIPYLVMEMVRGVHLDEFCDQRRLGIRPRLEIFLKVCDAVVYAHQNMVVHRDLKPRNILVDESGEPKLLDFGIAKIIEGDVDGDVRTDCSRIMTFDYASPEQKSGDPVNAVSDVYSLGVTLYKILTGFLPFEGQGDARRDVLSFFHGPVKKPSEVVLSETLNSSRERLSSSRSTSVHSLSRQLSGDIDSILIKALQNDPQERYPSVQEFSEDIRRHLSWQPVKSRRQTLFYRAGRFVRNNAIAVVFVFFLVVSGFVFGAYMKVLKDGADRERVKAERTKDFLVDIFRDSSPVRGVRWDDEELRALVWLLNRGAESATETLRDEPDVQAAIYDSLGWVFLGLELYQDAAPLLDASLAIRRKTASAHKEDFVGSLLNNAAYYKIEESFGRSEALLTEAVDLLREISVEHKNLPRALNMLAQVKEQQGRLAEAEIEYRQVLELRTNLFGDDHPELIESLNNLAAVLERQGEYDEAEELLRKALALAESYYSPFSEKILAELNNLGVLLQNKGDLDSAEYYLRRSLDLRRKLYSSDSSKLALGLNNWAILVGLLGRYEAAEEAFHEAEKIFAHVLGEEHSNYAVVLKNRAELYLAEGHFVEAEELASEAFEILTTAFPDGHWRVADAGSVLGECLFERGLYDEARVLLSSSHEFLEGSLGENARQTRNALQRLEKLTSRAGVLEKQEEQSQVSSF